MHPRLLSAFVHVAAFTSSWTAVAVVGFNVVDFAIAAALAVCIMGWIGQHRHLEVSFWMMVPAIGAFITVAWSVFVLDAIADSEMLLRVILTTAGVAILVTNLNSWGRPRVLMSVLGWWVAGIAVNAAAAITVAIGLLDLTGILDQATGERLSGLASHPNSLAFSTTIAIPAAVFLLSRAARTHIWWLLALGVVIAGLLLSQSRAGLLVGIPILIISLIVAIARSRARLAAIPFAILATAAAVAIAPGLIASTRLSDGAGSLSDFGRAQINEQAFRLFLDNPVLGAGFAAQTGVSVPLTVLTAGGITFAISYYFFVLRPLPGFVRNRRHDASIYGVLSIAAFLGFGLLNPVFMERATYWPILIPAVIAAGRPTRAKDADAGPRAFS